MNAITHTSQMNTGPRASHARTRQMPTRYHYRRNPGAYMRVEIVLLALVALALIWSAWVSRAASPSDLETLTTHVTQGQTLWQLAHDHPVPGLSTAETADLIAQMNGIDDGALQPGMTVEVPARDTAASALASR